MNVHRDSFTVTMHDGTEMFVGDWFDDDIGKCITFGITEHGNDEYSICSHMHPFTARVLANALLRIADLVDETDEVEYESAILGVEDMMNRLLHKRFHPDGEAGS